MPLNGSGTYSLPSPMFPAVSNTLIKASDYNMVLTDIASALSQAVFRDGQASFTSPQSMGNQKLTSVAAGTADTDAVNKGQLLQLFPIGAVYITANNVNPGTFIGGTWTQIAQGRTLLGVGTLGSDTYAAGATGGAARVTLSTSEMPWHNHGGGTGGPSADHYHWGSTDSVGAHTHTINEGSAAPGTGGGLTSGDDYTNIVAYTQTTSSNGAHFHNFTTSGASAGHMHNVSGEGDGAAHENRMPYLAVYFWQRTA